MKMSVSEIDRARKNPARFANERRNPAGRGFSSKNFHAYLVNTIGYFHKEGLPKAVSLGRFVTKCEEKLSQQNKFSSRLLELRGRLDDYLESFPNPDFEVVE